MEIVSSVNFDQRETQVDNKYIWKEINQIKLTMHLLSQRATSHHSVCPETPKQMAPKCTIRSS